MKTKIVVGVILLAVVFFGWKMINLLVDDTCGTDPSRHAVVLAYPDGYVRILSSGLLDEDILNVWERHAEKAGIASEDLERGTNRDRSYLFVDVDEEFDADAFKDRLFSAVRNPRVRDCIDNRTEFYTDVSPFFDDIKASGSARWMENTASAFVEMDIERKDLVLQLKEVRRESTDINLVSSNGSIHTSARMWWENEDVVSFSADSPSMQEARELWRSMMDPDRSNCYDNGHGMTCVIVANAQWDRYHEVLNSVLKTKRTRDAIPLFTEEDFCKTPPSACSPESMYCKMLLPLCDKNLVFTLGLAEHVTVRKVDEIGITVRQDRVNAEPSIVLDKGELRRVWNITVIASDRALHDRVAEIRDWFLHSNRTFTCAVRKDDTRYSECIKHPDPPSP